MPPGLYKHFATYLTLALPARAASTRAMRWLIAGWLSACITLLVVLELATPGFMQEYGLRPNRIFVEYLVYPREVFSTLVKGRGSQFDPDIVDAFIDIAEDFRRIARNYPDPV